MCRKSGTHGFEAEVEGAIPPSTVTKKAAQKPTAFMMMTKFAGVMVLKVEGHRQLVHPLSTVQQQYLLALRVPTTYFTAPPPEWIERR